MHKFITSLLLTLALLFGGAVTLAPAAQAARPGVTPSSACVSGYEFNNLLEGTPRAEAERFLDGPGRGDGDSLRVYRSCANDWAHAQVHVRYVRGRVFSVMGMRIGDGGRFDIPAKEGRSR
jgi:hypothetical protein